MSALDEVVTSILKCGVASPSLEEINWLIYIQLVLEDLSREFRVVEDSNERVPEVGFVILDGFLIEGWIIILLVEVQIRLQLAGSSRSTMDSMSSSSSSSPPRLSTAAAAAALVDPKQASPYTIALQQTDQNLLVCEISSRIQHGTSLPAWDLRSTPIRAIVDQLMERLQ
jgi:hypothetical protein